MQANLVDQLGMNKYNKSNSGRNKKQNGLGWCCCVRVASDMDTGWI